MLFSLSRWRARVRARTEEGGCALLPGDGRETSGLKSLLARPEGAMAQNPPSGVVCSAGVVDACCCLVSLSNTITSYGDRYPDRRSH